MQECSRCLINDTIPGVTFDSNGECNYCNIHDALDKKYSHRTFEKQAGLIRNDCKNRQYDCIIGVSGGFDSSLMLHLAVTVWKLRPLVIHFDNGYNSDIAESNMMNMVRALSVPFIRYYPDRKEYDNLNKAFLMASVSEADIPNDIAMSKLIMETAEKYNIKYIFNGHNFRTEGSCPLGWTYMDGKYIKSVYKAYAGLKLRNYPILTIWDQIRCAIKGIKQIRPLYYLDFDMDKYRPLLASLYGWRNYGGKHCENGYTEFVGSYLLPKKFGIDKRILYLSALVRSGLYSKELAKHDMKTATSFDADYIKSIRKGMGINTNQFKDIMAQKRNTFKDYNTYHKSFKRFKWLIKIAVWFKIFPETFYIKYTKDV